MTSSAKSKQCPYCGESIGLDWICCDSCLAEEAWMQQGKLKLCPICDRRWIGKFERYCRECLTEGAGSEVKNQQLSKNWLAKFCVYFLIFFMAAVMLMALLWMASCTLKAMQSI